MPRPKTDSTFKKDSFLSKHSRLMLLIGATVVVLTNVIKDDLKEAWSANAEALKNANYQYLLRTAQTEQAAEVSLLRKKFDTIEQRLPLSPTKDGDRALSSNDHLSLDENDAEAEFYQLHFHDQTIDNLTLFLDALPSNDPLVVKVHNLKAIALHGTPPKETPLVRYFTKPSDADYPTELAQVQANGRRMNTANEQISSQLGEVETLMLKDVTQLQSSNEIKARIATWISGALYLVGVILGLAGKFEGIDIDAGE